MGKIIPEPFEWCVVPTGKVTLEKGGYLTQATTFEVPEFQIARYPITNAQFEVFVTADDGWRDLQWWNYSPMAEAWRKLHDRCETASQSDCDECPRTNLTWHSSIAFTYWLSTKTGELITLPSEQQWQRAAQGNEDRIYPWGHTLSWDRMNLGPNYTHNTTPVTQYLNSASPYGVLDLVGNIWQYCLTDFVRGKADVRYTKVYMLRGGRGAFSNVIARNRPSDKSRGDMFTGFRVAATTTT